MKRRERDPQPPRDDNPVEDSSTVVGTRNASATQPHDCEKYAPSLALAATTMAATAAATTIVLRVLVNTPAPRLSPYSVTEPCDIASALFFSSSASASSSGPPPCTSGRTRSRRRTQRTSSVGSSRISTSSSRPGVRPRSPSIRPGNPKPQDDLAREARRFRLTSEDGDAIARLRVPRLDLNLVVVNGTSTSDLRRGPGRHLESFMPGEGKLVYVAGHRTTYGAPFSDIDQLEPGRQDLGRAAVRLGRVPRDEPSDRGRQRPLRPRVSRSRGARAPGVPSALLREPALPRLRPAGLDAAREARFRRAERVGERAPRRDRADPGRGRHPPVATGSSNPRHRRVRDQLVRRPQGGRRRRRGAHGALARARGGVRRAERPCDVHARRTRRSMPRQGRSSSSATWT